jgi:predicted nucleotidyltransferase
MKMEYEKNIVYNKNPMLVLSYLSKQNAYGQGYIASQVAKDLNISIGSVFEILKRFNEMDFIEGARVGRATIYKVNRSHPLIKSFRIFENILEINNLVNSLKRYCRKIILFGSCARGEDTAESDIDLFIETDGDNTDEIWAQLSDYSIDREIKPVIVDTIELIELHDKDKAFYEEIMKGIELWGGNDEFDR